MKIIGRLTILAAAAAITMASCTGNRGNGNYPIRPVPFTSVKMTDNFWAPRIYNMLTINPGAAGIQGFHNVRTALRFRIENGSVSDMEVGEWKKSTNLINQI